MRPEVHPAGIAPESVERFKAKVRDLWLGRQSLTSNELRDRWRSFIQGWWGYYQLVDLAAMSR